LERIAKEAAIDPSQSAAAPRTTPVTRVDEAMAARKLIATFDALD
jgi:hypothetical protein